MKQEHEGYEFCHKQMAECDRQLKQYLQQREDRSQGAPLPEEKRKGRLKKKRANKPQFDLREGLFRMTGTDLTRIDGIDVMTAMTIISEAGWDMSKWPDEDHFVSWLRLCPDNRISGNKVIGKGRLPTNNPISIALKMAASTLRQSKTYLGAQFRRFRTRLGAPIAITWTKEQPSTSFDTESYRSSASRPKPKSSDTESPQYRRRPNKEEFLAR